MFVRLLPGDPASAILGASESFQPTEAALVTVRQRLGLDPRDPARLAASVRIHRLHARSRALDSLHGHAHDRAGPRASRGHDADDADDGRRGARARYVRTARAKGLTERVLIYRHVLKN